MGKVIKNQPFSQIEMRSAYETLEDENRKLQGKVARQRKRLRDQNEQISKLNEHVALLNDDNLRLERENRLLGEENVRLLESMAQDDKRDWSEND